METDLTSEQAEKLRYGGGRSPADDYGQEKLPALLFGSIFEQRVNVRVF